MRLNCLHVLTMVSLTACTTQNIEINIHKDREVANYHYSEPNMNNDKTISIEQISPVVKEIPQGWCPRFEAPDLGSVPSLPKKIANKEPMSEAEVIEVLTDYAYELRKKAAEDRRQLQHAYSKYLENCKK